jgi:hypothetical protein
MQDRPQRLLVFDVLESYARERDIDVSLERRKDSAEWRCLLSDGRSTHRGSGPTARSAIRGALAKAGVDASGDCS